IAKVTRGSAITYNAMMVSVTLSLWVVKAYKVMAAFGIVTLMIMDSYKDMLIF
ncbi:hypothetical protein HAX54_001668, partial [Datura stramonium]|nr:hypothetical protein [Datura stramonium]